ncbi:EAL domain-containing protein [Bacillus salacetis]|uniref:EAL domain-containing protein n=1 Tax=Bacillus salacetis TaxID=2315464 RepID=A0A3A1R991_9BACI|nr:EAL domain-containing protein [Bacillus salacetis]RIW39049.1 EAL domain-containing protein [Bacillus salacetis]
MPILFPSIRKKRRTEMKDDFTEQEYFKFLFEHSPDIIVHYDSNGKLLHINKATTCITGHQLSGSELRIADFTPDAYKSVVRNHFKAAVKGTVQKFKSQAYHKDGSLLDLEITYIPIHETKKTIGVYAIIHEVTEKVALQLELKAKNRELEDVSDTLEAAIWSYDNLEKSITFCTTGIKHISEMEAEEFLNGHLKWRDLVCRDDLNKYDEDMKVLHQGHTISHRYRITTPSGKQKWLNEKIIPIKDSQDQIIRFHGIVTDTTKDKELGERVEHLLHHDSLTALPNRKMLENEMRHCIEQKQNFAFIYVHLNRFKYINETLGPVIGDELLEEAASRLKEYQENGVFVSRFSNDDFVLLLKNMNGLQKVTDLCREIIGKLKEPYAAGEFELLLTTSIGASLYPSDSKSITELFQNASAAMNRAKELGKNTYQIYSPENSIDAYKRFVLEKDFRNALKNDELQLYFQPKVDSRLNQIIGAEALLRWDHPEWGLVSPNEFIPYAEENGFIIEVGEWVLERACVILQDWRKQGLSLVPVSINLSPQHFLVKNLKANLLSVLEKYDISPELIELEITEAVFLQHEETVKQTIDELREMGIRILIDDFGTGYTSFAYLKDLTVDGIKIDRSYTKELGDNTKNGAIIKNLASLSADLNMSATIEGIETEEQLKFLKKIKCHLIQGYLYSKPVPAEKFQELLKGKTIKPDKSRTSAVKHEQRRYFRILPPVPLEGSATIISINKKKVTTGKTGVAVTDIGPGGLGFISHIQFPPDREILLNFSLKISGKEIVHNGKIAWREEIDENFFRYGVDFQLHPGERESLTKTLNQFTLALKRNTMPGGTDMIEGDPFEYLGEVKKR